MGEVELATLLIREIGGVYAGLGCFLPLCACVSVHIHIRFFRLFQLQSRTLFGVACPGAMFASISVRARRVSPNSLHRSFRDVGVLVKSRS